MPEQQKARHRFTQSDMILVTSKIVNYANHKVGPIKLDELVDYLNTYQEIRDIELPPRRIQKIAEQSGVEIVKPRKSLPRGTRTRDVARVLYLFIQHFNSVAKEENRFMLDEDLMRRFDETRRSLGESQEDDS